MARIRSFNGDHPGVLPQFPGQLPITDIDGIHPLGPMLEEAVRKTARRGSDVKANGIGKRDLKRFQRFLKFEASPADEGEILLLQRNA